MADKTDDKAEKVRRPNATEQLDELITELSARCRLHSWSSFVEELELPSELIPAMMTGRVELLKLLQPRDMKKDEVQKLLGLIGGLMETNFALQEHARQVGRSVKLWTDAFAHLRTVGYRIEHFANFRRTDESDEFKNQEAA